MDVKHLIGYIHQVKGGFELNELVSLVLEASCSTAYIIVVSLDMVETTPLLMDLTPLASLSSFLAYILYFFIHL